MKRRLFYTRVSRHRDSPSLSASLLWIALTLVFPIALVFNT